VCFTCSVALKHLNDIKYVYKQIEVFSTGLQFGLYLKCILLLQSIGYIFTIYNAKEMDQQKNVGQDMG